MNPDDAVPQLRLTPSEFGSAVSRTSKHVRCLCRQGRIAGAHRGATGRWSIPLAAVDYFLRGVYPASPLAAVTTDERLRQLWRKYEGKEWPLAS